MDRREALKKLAIGGTIAAGSSAIVSSPVFAASGPTIPAATLTIAQAAIDATGTIIATQPAATCMASAASPTATISSSSLSVSSATLTITNTPQTLSTAGANYANATPVNFSGPVTVNMGMTTIGNVVDGDMFTATVTSTFSCTYAGMAVSTTCTTTIVGTATVASMAMAAVWNTSSSQTCT